MKKITLGIGAFALALGVVGMTAGTSLAYQGNTITKGPHYSDERHNAMEKAFENKDYAAWKELMQGKGMVLQIINKDNFSKLAEMHGLMEQGQVVEAQKIRQELGLGLHRGSLTGKGRGAGGMRRNLNY